LRREYLVVLETNHHLPNLFNLRDGSSDILYFSFVFMYILALFWRFLYLRTIPGVPRPDGLEPRREPRSPPEPARRQKARMVRLGCALHTQWGFVWGSCLPSF